MLRHVFSAAAIGLVSFVLPLAAQQAPSSDGLRSLPPDPGAIAGDGVFFAQADVALGRPWSGFPALALASGESFFFPGSFAWMEPAPEFLPPFTAVEPRRVQPRGVQPISEDELGSYAELGDSRRRLFYTGGEVDFVYGQFTGKNGGDFYRGYIVGEIGTDKFRLSVGAAYGEWNGRGYRRGR